ncbi:hypothetical protein NY78_1246 [Desulfovibrio sp. TomC]|nr:hypothetical protein NY78_1246 [Desulfovibrio sp. TomC]
MGLFQPNYGMLAGRSQGMRCPAPSVLPEMAASCIQGRGVFPRPD